MVLLGSTGSNTEAGTQATIPSHPLYTPLNVSRQEIRLLTLLRGDKSLERVSCRLETVELTPDLEFAAISYVWGDPKATKDIIVNGQRFKATINLEAALRHFRDRGTLRRQHAQSSVSPPSRLVAFSNLLKRHDARDRELPLWADAICINQDDIAERGTQVKLMGSIYSTAVVISWLGPPGEKREDIAIKAMKDFSHLFRKHYGETVSYFIDAREDGFDEEFFKKSSKCIGRQPELCRRLPDIPWGNTTWNAIWNFIRLEYWKRIWIVQELTLSHSSDNHLVCSGDECITLNQIALFVRFLNNIEQAPESCTKDLPKSMSKTIWFTLASGRMRALSFWGLLRLRRFENGPLYVVAVCNTARATDPRDMVYGLLNTLKIDLEPDYYKSTRQVYLDWFQQVISYMGVERAALECLKWAGIGLHARDRHNLPSWLPDLSRLCDSTRINVSVDVPRADLPGATSCELDPTGVLRVSGTVCDVISQTLGWKMQNAYAGLVHTCIELVRRGSDMAAHTMKIPHLQALFYNLATAMELSQIETIDFPPRPTSTLAQIFRAVLSDYVTADVMADLGFDADHEQFRLELDSRFRNCQDPYTEAQWEEHYLQTKTTSKFLEEYERFRVGILLLQGCVYFQTVKGYGGFGPAGTISGDQVCLIHQSNALSLFRESDQSYRHVGTCLSYGLSGEQVLSMIKGGELGVKKFDIA